MKQLLVLVAALGGCAPAAPRPAGDPGELFRDDFSGFPTGLLSYPVGQLNPAIQEYHWLSRRGVDLGPWENSLVYMDAWAKGEEEDGQPYLEMHLGPDNQRMNVKHYSPQFVTGSPEWTDVAVEALVKPLSKDDMAGLVFRYHTNRHHYVFVLEGGKRARLAVRQALEKTYRVSDWRELGAAEFAYDTKTYYRLRVENDGPRIRCLIDGAVVITAEDSEIRGGKVGVTANVPSRFRDFRAASTDGAGIRERIARRADEEARERARNPKAVLWKKFETPEFGCGRNVRFGDLDGDGVPEMLFCQIVSKVDTGNFVEASCLTAVKLDGTVLWQVGKPNPHNGLLTSDTPFQIHEGDVYLVKDFKLQVLDGKTGKLKRWMWMPEVPEEYRKKKFELKERPHELNAGDSISFVDLSGKGRRTEILLKDRYRYFWVYDQNFKLLWSGAGQLGHFPFPCDPEGHGRDDVFIGYSRWTPEGTQLWSHDADLLDHADGLAVGNFSGDPKAEPRVYAVGSDEGFILFDLRGNILKHHRVGHPQNMAVAKLRPEMPGLQIASINFWKNPGIVTLYDTDGNILQQEEPIHS
ncbi:MAG TPA: hypothetical protein VEN81_17395, partial [Planctomycetota bacterium]|nr:hypothetical protein [Planctomycetota bacterium]